jgi:hypothetical protein
VIDYTVIDVVVDDGVQFLLVGSVMLGQYAVHFVDDQFRK